MALIPLYRGRGAAARVVAHAVVDDDDAPVLSEYRWRLLQSTEHLRYAVRCGRGRPTYMHIVIAGAGMDHVDRDGLNNRRTNLRRATHAQNMQNRRRRSDNTSGERGVSRCKDRWLARVKRNGKVIFARQFRFFADAVAAVRAARRMYLTHAVD